MPLFTVDLQVPREFSGERGAILGLGEAEGSAESGTELISSHQLYSDPKSVYYRVEIFGAELSFDRLDGRLAGAKDRVLQHRIREDLSVYEGPLLEIAPNRKIDFRKTFVATAPETLAQAQERLYSRPEDLDRLRKDRVGLISDGSRGRSGQNHQAALRLERDAYLIARHAGLQAVPLWLDTRNEEDLIRSVQALQGNFGSLRLSGMDTEYAMQVAERLEESLQIPVVHAEATERAVLIAAILQNAARFHGINLNGLTGAILGLGPEGEGLLNLLSRAGVARVYGIDADLRQASRFEKSGGVASSIDQVYEAADFVIVTPDCPVRLDESRFHAGQLLLSFHRGAIRREAVAPAAQERCYATGEPHPVFVLPGLFAAIHRSRPEKLTGEELHRFTRTLLTRGDQNGFLPIPSQDLFKTQTECFEAGG